MLKLLEENTLKGTKSNLLPYLLIIYDEFLQRHRYCRVNLLEVSVLSAEIIKPEEELFLLQRTTRFLNIDSGLLEGSLTINRLVPCFW